MGYLTNKLEYLLISYNEYVHRDIRDDNNKK